MHVQSWTIPFFLIRRSVTSVIPLPDMVRTVVTLVVTNWYYGGNHTFILDSFTQDRAVWRMTWEKDRMLYFSVWWGIIKRQLGLVRVGKKYQYIVVLKIQCIYFTYWDCLSYFYIYNMFMIPSHSCNDSYSYCMFMLYISFSRTMPCNGWQKRAG